MLEPKILIFHWFFKQKWSKAPANMGARPCIEPSKKPLEPQSDKLFGELPILGRYLIFESNYICLEVGQIHLICVPPPGAKN